MGSWLLLLALASLAAVLWLARRAGRRQQERERGQQ